MSIQHGAQLGLGWRFKWFTRPFQRTGMNVEDYHAQFCDWKEEMVSLSFPAEEQDYIDGFIENLSWVIRSRLSKYRSSRSRLINAFYDAKFEESMMFIEEYLKEIKANRKAEELTAEEQMVQQPIEEREVESPLSTTSFKAMTTENPAVGVICDVKRLELADFWDLEENDGPIFDKIAVQNEARKVFAKMPGPILEEDVLGFEGIKVAHHMFDEVVEMVEPILTGSQSTSSQYEQLHLQSSDEEFESSTATYNSITEELEVNNLLDSEEKMSKKVVDGQGDSKNKALKMFDKSTEPIFTGSKSISGQCYPFSMITEVDFSFPKAGIQLVEKAEQSFPSKLEVVELAYEMFDEMTDLVPTARHSFSSVSSIRNERNDDFVLNRADYCKFDEVLGVRLTNFPSLSKLEFNPQVFDPGTDVLSRQDYESQLYANEGHLNANEDQMNLISLVPPCWVQEVAFSHSNDANLNHDLNYYLGTEDEIDAMRKSHYVPTYVEQADGIFVNDYLVFPFVCMKYSGCFNFMAEDNAILCPPELNSIMYLEVAYVSTKVSPSHGVYDIQIDFGLEAGVVDEERWSIGPLASWRHEEQRALKHSTTIDYSVDAVKLVQIAVTENMEISERRMKEKWVFVCVNVINQGQNDKIWGFNSTTEDEGAQIWCYWGYLQHFGGGCLIKLSTKLMMVSLMIVFSSNSHCGMRMWQEKMFGSAIFADDCFVIVGVKNLIWDLCHGKGINLGLGEQLTGNFSTWMLYAWRISNQTQQLLFCCHSMSFSLFQNLSCMLGCFILSNLKHFQQHLSSNGYVTIAKSLSFVWDPGRSVTFFYILEDNDDFERVGKDIVLMDTTLEMTGLITILGCLSGQPDLDALYASCCIFDGLGDTVGALDDIGLIPNALVFSTAELEHYIWDPGSFVSVSQLSWGVRRDFHLTTLPGVLGGIFISPH